MTTGRAVKALEQEAVATQEEEVKPVTFEYDGESYTVNPEDVDDVHALKAYEQDKIITFCELVLGPKQWFTFTSKKRRSKDIQGICEALLEATTAANPGE